MAATHERRIALFIDFENLVTNTGFSSSNFELQPSLDRLLDLGKVVFKRAYCDWSRFREAKGGLHELGVELIDVPPSTSAGKNAAEAFACARKQCTDGGAAVEDCLEMTYCDYGWAVDVFMQSTEGNHWHEYYCGWKTRKDAEAAGLLACNPERKKDLTECTTVQIYDPEANPQMEN